MGHKNVGFSGVIQEVDANRAAYHRLRDASGNDIAVGHRDKLASTQDALLIAGKNDEFGTILRTDRKGNLMTGNYTPELLEAFEGATVNVQKWTQTSTTFVPAQATLTGYSFNSTSLTTVNAVHILQSQRLFYRLPRVPLQYKSRKRHNMVTGSIADFGFGVPSGTTLVVPNGVQVRMTNSGGLQLVMTVNSVEVAIDHVVSKVASNGNTVGANLNMSNSYYTNSYFVYDLILDDDNAVLTIQDTSTGEMVGFCSLPVPVGAYKMWGATALPVYERMYNSVAPSTAPVYILTEMQVVSLDSQLGLVPSMAGSLSMSAGRNPFTGAATENHTNSAAPASATLSNTAAGYTTLGGKFQFAAVAGAETDYALFGYTVPAGSRFICEGIKIDVFNMGAASATTATALEWSMGFNSSAVSLATGNIVRRQIGVQSIPVGTAVGVRGDLPLDVTFPTPEVVESGRFLHVILKMPVGTATASQIIRGQVHIKGRVI